MEVIVQTLAELLEDLSPLEVEWKDEIALNIIKRLRDFPIKKHYELEDLKSLLDADFREGKLICGLFLGLSKDRFEGALTKVLGQGGTGSKRYQSDEKAYLEALETLGVPAAMTSETARELLWHDRLVERLRSGRGSAISGQRRGRGVEDFVEAVVKRVFGDRFDSRCNFEGSRGRAKCDFAIPSKIEPRIIIESKG